MKRIAVIIIIIILPMFSWAVGIFPQSEYIRPHYGKKIYFLENSRIVFKSEYDSGYTAKPFINNYSGTYNIRISDPFTYLDIETDFGDKYSLVVHWNKDTIVLSDPETKEILIAIGLESEPPIDLLPHLNYFNSLSATSYFIESYGGKTYKYMAENLSNWDLTTPWVEGVDGAGIGEKIKFSTYDRCRAIAFVNGYFDPSRPDLYYANNRVKKIIIRSFDAVDGQCVYETSWDLEDTYNLQILTLPDMWQYFELEIVEIYQGVKYDDTCISGLFNNVGLDMYDEGNYPFVVLPQPIEKLK